jgi:hypothetical protein
MIARNSESTQAEYLIIMKPLKDHVRVRDYLRTSQPWDNVVDTRNWHYHMPGYLMARLFLEHEPEQSRRLAQLTFTNWLSQCALPPSERAPLINGAPRGRALPQVRLP